jgi:ribosomal protein S27E
MAKKKKASVLLVECPDCNGSYEIKYDMTEDYVPEVCTFCGSELIDTEELDDSDLELE